MSAPSFVSVMCPMPACKADLYITWHSSRPVFTDDTADDLKDPRDGYTSSWEIGCTQGHVLLLPPDTAEDSYTFGECASCDTAPIPDPTSEFCGHGDLARLHALTQIAVT